MLERRITYNSSPPTSLPAPPHTRATSLPRHMPSVAPITIPVSCTTALSCYDSTSPSSIVSSMGTPPPALYPTPFYTTPVTPAASEIKTEEVQYNYLYDQPFNGSWNYSNNYNLTSDHVPYYNTTSCVDAANNIPTMRSDIGPELETGFGCRAPGQSCYVNNHLVFGMINKHSSQYINI